jgi:hypothetical protein
LSVAGDLWQLGSHRLICGDSTSADVVRRLLGDVRPLLMVTDPPYGVEYDPSWRNQAGAAKTKRTGKVLNDDRADWCEVWALFPGDVAYVWHGALHSSTVAASLVAAFFAVRPQIIWAKDRHHRRLQACGTVDGQINRTGSLRLDPVAEAVEGCVTGSTLHCRLDLGPVLVVVAQGRQRDLGLSRLAVDGQINWPAAGMRSGSTAPRWAVAGNAESRTCSAARMVSWGGAFDNENRGHLVSAKNICERRAPDTHRLKVQEGSARMYQNAADFRPGAAHPNILLVGA